MVKLKPGDKVQCRLKEGSIVICYRSYDEMRTFEVIAISEDDYYIFVPEYVLVKETVAVDFYRCKKYDIDPRFLGEQMAFISESQICSFSKMDGACCGICQDFIRMAEADAHGTFVCYTCRGNPYH